MKEYKNFTLPQEPTPDTADFFKLLDEAFESGTQKDKISQLQEQINDLYKKADPLANAPLSNKADSRERELNVKWFKNFVQNKDNTQVDLQLKSFDNYLHTGDAADGGTLVPSLLQAEIFHFVEEYGYARRKMRYMPFGGPGNTRTLPLENTSVSVEWVDEAGKKPLSSISIGYVTQELKKLACIVIATEELLEDSAVDILQYLGQRIGSAIAKEEDEMFFAGDTDAGDTWDGILHMDNTTTVAMTSDDRLEDVTPEHLLNMVYAVEKYARTGAEFYFNSDVMLELMKARAAAVSTGDGEGKFLMQDPTGSEPAKIWGYPVNIVDILPASEDATDADEPFAIFGNLQKTCVYGDKQGLRIKILTEATLKDSEDNEFSLAQHDAQAIRVFKRVGFCSPLPSGIAILQTGPVS